MDGWRRAPICGGGSVVLEPENKRGTPRIKANFNCPKSSHILGASGAAQSDRVSPASGVSPLAMGSVLILLIALKIQVATYFLSRPAF